MNNLRPHKLALLFPAVPDDEFQSIVQDIKAGGLLEPIWLYEGKVLDGWHRYQAAKKAGIEPKTREWHGKDPLAFVVSMNVMRRHLNEGQRAMLLVKAADEAGTLDPGGNFDRRGGEQKQSADLAKQVNVGERTITRARRVLEVPELEAAVIKGTISLNTANEVAPNVMRHKDPTKRKQAAERYIKAYREPKERPSRVTAKYVGPKRWEDVPAVAQFLKKSEAVATIIRHAKELADLGKYSPEAGRFVAKRLRDRAGEMMAAADYVERKSK